MSAITFTIEKRIKGALGRAGILSTPHGIIETPAFVSVGTAATVKSVSPEELWELGAQVVLANTYHLYLQPGEKIIAQAGGLSSFMGWKGPTMTDSGGFQVFSLGFRKGQKGITKVLKEQRDLLPDLPESHISEHSALVSVDAEGVTFTSHRDGTTHRFTPNFCST